MSYHSLFFKAFAGFFVLIFSLLVYAAIISDRVSVIQQRLYTVTPDSLAYILITPTNPDWPVNLTLDTLKIEDKTAIKKITNALNNLTEKYPGRGNAKTWQADLILVYNSKQNIRLEVVHAFNGVCVFFTNTMGNPKYRCNNLKGVLEEMAHYTENVGGA